MNTLKKCLIVAGIGIMMADPSSAIERVINGMDHLEAKAAHNTYKIFNMHHHTQLNVWDSSSGYIIPEYKSPYDAPEIEELEVEDMPSPPSELSIALSKTFSTGIHWIEQTTNDLYECLQQYLEKCDPCCKKNKEYEKIAIETIK